MPSQAVVSKRVVISGGELKEGDVWVPSELHIVNGQSYLPLSYRDRRLAAFCGMPNTSRSSVLAECGFLEMLKHARNASTPQLVQQALAAKDPFGAPLGAGKKRSFVHMDPDEVAKEVAVDMPAVDFEGEHCDQMKIYVLTESDPRRLVRMRLTGDAMDYVRIAMRSSLGDGSRQWRKHAERASISVPSVRMDYRRRSMYVQYQDGDGRQKTKYMKPTDTSQDEVNACAEKLREWFQENNHADAAQPGGAEPAVAEPAGQASAEPVEEPIDSEQPCDS